MNSKTKDQTAYLQRLTKVEQILQKQDSAKYLSTRLQGSNLPANIQKQIKEQFDTATLEKQEIDGLVNYSKRIAAAVPQRKSVADNTPKTSLVSAVSKIFGVQKTDFLAGAEPAAEELAEMGVGSEGQEVGIRPARGQQQEKQAIINILQSWQPVTRQKRRTVIDRILKLMPRIKETGIASDLITLYEIFEAALELTNKTMYSQAVQMFKTDGEAQAMLDESAINAYFEALITKGIPAAVAKMVTPTDPVPGVDMSPEHQAELVPE